MCLPKRCLLCARSCLASGRLSNSPHCPRSAHARTRARTRTHTAPGSRGSLVQHPSRPSSFVDMTAAFAEHTSSGAPPSVRTAPSAAADSNSRDPRGGSTSRSVRRDSGWGAQSAGGGRGGVGGGDGGSRGAIISEFALSALGGPSGGGGGRGSPQALSPTYARTGPPPGSVLSSFASPASWR